MGQISKPIAAACCGMFSVDTDKRWVYGTVAAHFGLPDAADIYEAAVRMGHPPIPETDATNMKAYIAKLQSFTTAKAASTALGDNKKTRAALWATADKNWRSLYNWLETKTSFLKVWHTHLKDDRFDVPSVAKEMRKYQPKWFRLEGDVQIAEVPATKTTEFLQSQHVVELTRFMFGEGGLSDTFRGSDAKEPHAEFVKALFRWGWKSGAISYNKKFNQFHSKSLPDVRKGWRGASSLASAMLPPSGRRQPDINSR
jgi:hypothetical protein